MRPIDKILVGVDFSPSSDEAVQHALNAARHHGAELVLAHVCHIEGFPVDRDSIGDDVFHQVARWNFEQTRTDLHDLRDRLVGQGAVVSDVLVEGRPGKALCEAAERLGAALVVVGSHGRTGIPRFLMGSVAEHVARFSGTSVLVTRPPVTGAGGYRRILVPTDFEPHSDEALRTALQFAAPDALVRLLHCWDIPASGFMTAAGLTGLCDDIAAQVETLGAGVVAKYRRPGVNLSFEGLRCSTRHGIQLRLQTGAYDLAVVGHRGQRGVRGFMTGSVAEATVRHSPCSVLVAHASGT
jgi:nucleotide-binding universal stress UspA family protein